jgi:hypothetical protein
MRTNERKALSIKLNDDLKGGDNHQEHTTTSGDDEMATGPHADESIVIEDGNNTTAGDPRQASEIDVERGNVTNEDNRSMAPNSPVFQSYQSYNGTEVKRIIIRSFRALQLYRIHDLQSKLRVKEDLFNGGDSAAIDKLLQEYGKLWTR